MDSNRGCSLALFRFDSFVNTPLKTPMNVSHKARTPSYPGAFLEKYQEIEINPAYTDRPAQASAQRCLGRTCETKLPSPFAFSPSTLAGSLKLNLVCLYILDQVIFFFIKKRLGTRLRQEHKSGSHKHHKKYVR